MFARKSDERTSVSDQTSGHGCEELFVPHAILLTEISATSLVVSMMRPRLKTIELEPGSDPATFVEQVLARLPDEVQFFGRVTGFAVNYSQDHAEIFHRKGKRLTRLASIVAP